MGGEHPDGGGLAGAAGPEQPEHLATAVARGRFAAQVGLDSIMGLAPGGGTLTDPIADWPAPGRAFTGYGEYNQRELLRLWGTYIDGSPPGTPRAEKELPGDLQACGAARGRRPRAAYEVTSLLTAEAEVLDQQRRTDWLALLTDDVRYRMPVRVTTARGDRTNVGGGMSHGCGSSAGTV